MTGKGDKMTGWTGGAIYHTDEFLADPFKAGVDRLLPALKAGGVNIDSQLELTKVLGTLFRNINAAAFANELWQKKQQSRIVKDKGYIDKVEDPETIYKRLLSTDPTVALGAPQKRFRVVSHHPVVAAHGHRRRGHVWHG